MTSNPFDLSVTKLHEHLLGAIAPRPIAFVTTIDKEGNVNLSPFSFFNVFGANPPILVFSPARSGKTGASKNTHDNVLEVPECVVNIAHYDILQQMNLAAGMYPKGVNEFEKSGLTAMPSDEVKPPRVAECNASFECKVLNVLETGTSGGAGNLIVCKVVKIHIKDEVLDSEGSIDPTKMNYIARLGKQWWCRIGADNMFQVPAFKMADAVGIGFDRLPIGFLQSTILTGNDLALLASVQELPAASENINDEWKALLKELSKDFSQAAIRLHQFAKEKIAVGKIDEAWQVLLHAEKFRTSVNS